MKTGDKVRGDIESFLVEAVSVDGRLVTLRGENGNRWSVYEQDIGMDENGPVVGEEVYDHPVD